jgi:hypothetical protein
MVVIHDWTKWEGDYEKSWAEYKSMWITGNKVQYDMCAKYPYHRRKDEIAAKVWIIGRSYMSGIERHSRKGLVGTVEFFYKNGKAIDALFSSLKAVREPLTVQKVQHVIDIHGKFLTILRKLTRNRNAIRSFASKYMHFHCAAVPIFDNIAYGVIKQRKPRGWYPLTDSRIVKFKKPLGADDIYYGFCLSFFAMYKDMKVSGLKVDVRKLDTYLLWNQ